MALALSSISSTFDAIIGWFSQISEAVGFDLWGFLVAITVLSVGLAILVHPAVGGSDKASKGGKGGKDE